MAVDCLAELQGGVATRTLQNDFPLTGTISNQFEGAFFKFKMIEFETVFFTLLIQPNTTAAINVTFTLFRKDGTVYTNLGTSLSDEFFNQFEYSATPGEYYICMGSTASVDYTITAEFTQFPFVAINDGDAYHGAYMPPFDFAQPESFCASEVFYEIIEGELPQGLTLQSDGIIFGVPIEQDCEVKSTDSPPSFTWWEDDSETGSRKATSLNYRIVIRAALVDSPETYDDREFFICVHNNWDNDRAAFIDSIPNFETPVFEIRGAEPWNTPTPEPELPESETRLSEIETSLCPCEPEEVKPLTLEEIQELSKQVYIAPEFQGLVSIDESGMCVVCDVEEEPTFQLQSIEVELCQPCAEPIVIEGLSPIPETMCPICVETIEIEVQEDPFVPGIPLICYPELLNRMMNSKVCLDYHRCGPTTAIYKERIISGDSLPKSMCDEDC